MNGSADNTAHGAPEKPGRGERFLNLATARKMLPLVQHIVADILENQRNLARLLPELDDLDRRRRELDWPHRARRYQLRGEIAVAEFNLHEAMAELVGLGVELAEKEPGAVRFPTLINGRRAYFCWSAGEEDITFWCFGEEDEQRPIPASWMRSAGLLSYSKS
jgi:hypothetical protein